MRHLFKRLRHRLGWNPPCHCECEVSNKSCDVLDKVPENSIAEITCNNDHRTVERGLYIGVQVRVMRNEQDEPNLVVAVGDARYVLDRRIARRIMVKLV